MERALFLSGSFSELNYANLHKLQWSRAARTDRGVHAVAQCCAMKLSINVHGRQELIEAVNVLLPTDIRVHGITKVTKAFNSKIACTGRRYHYLLPAYVLKGTDLVSPKLAQEFESQGPIIDTARNGGFAEPGASSYLGHDALSKVRADLAAFRASPEQLELLQTALHCYEGTKNFHNFTQGKKFDDDSAKRFITAFRSSEPFVDDVLGVQWILLTVEGQSFLLHQIRKMVSSRRGWIFPYFTCTEHRPLTSAGEFGDPGCQGGCGHGLFKCGIFGK